MGVCVKTRIMVYYAPNLVTGYARNRIYSEISLKCFKNAVNMLYFCLHKIYITEL